jgi:hypothetical protein
MEKRAFIQVTNKAFRLGSLPVFYYSPDRYSQQEATDHVVREIEKGGDFITSLYNLNIHRIDARSFPSAEVSDDTAQGLF